jgi:hypothetical protein
MKPYLLLALTAVVCATAAAEEVVMGPELIISQLDNQQLHPRVAYNSVEDEFLVVWHNQWPGNRDIYAQRLDGEGNPLSWFAVAFVGNDRIMPDVAYDPVHNRYLVVYLYDCYGDGTDWDVVGRFIDWDGPDPAWPEIVIDGNDDSQADPQVVFGRAQEEFMVVWTSVEPGVVDHVEGSRIASGDPATPAVSPVFAIAGDTRPRRHPDVAYNLARNECLVVYDIGNGGATGYDIAASRLRGDGVVLGAEIVVSDRPGEETEPVVAANPDQDGYSVLWMLTEGTPAVFCAYSISCAFFNGNGSQVPPVLVFAGSENSAGPAIDCHIETSHWAMVWSRASGAVHDNILGGLLKLYVAPTWVWWTWDEFAAVDTGGATETTHPAIASGRKTTLVVWEHDRPGTTFQDLHGRVLWPPIFVDGLELGTTDAWSATVGQTPGP